MVTLPSLSHVWTLLARVADPEIPVISIVDLGIVRAVEWITDGTAEPELRVVVTPTYSGCPATTMIQRDIHAMLRANGFERVRLDIALSPPWSTDAISEHGLRKLSAYGIAPPHPNGSITCPTCHAFNVERISAFGSTPCKALYRCCDCREPFDRFKCH